LADVIVLGPMETFAPQNQAPLLESSEKVFQQADFFSILDN